MLERLPIALAQGKIEKTSENLLNEICQIIYSFYWAKQTVEKVCIQQYYKINKGVIQNGHYIYEFCK